MTTGVKKGLSLLLCLLMVSAVLLCVTAIRPQAISVIQDIIYDDDRNILICEGQMVRLSFSTVRIISFNNWYVRKGDPSGISFGNHPANENYCNVIGEKSGYYTVEGKIGNSLDWYRKPFDIHVVPQYYVGIGNQKLLNSMKVNQSIPLSKIFPGFGGDSWIATGIRLESSDTSIFGFTSDNNLMAVKKGTATLTVSTTRLSSKWSHTYTVRVGMTSGSTASSSSSSASATKKTVTLKTPQITKIENTLSGQKVTWGKVSGAAKYRVFYKKGSKWAKLIDTTATSVVNKVAKPGKKYIYTVRCLDKNGKYVSGVNNTGKSAVFVGVPKITKIENLASGQRVTWGKMSGAAKYRVLYKKDSKWVKLCDTASTSVVNKIAKSGKRYSYTVRCLNKNGKYNSGIDSTGKSAIYIGLVKITKIENYVAGQGVTWNKVGGAAKYRVFYKKNSKWVKLCDTAATSVVNKIAKAGQKYIYTVQCISSDGKSYTGPRDNTGKGAVFVAAPKINSFANSQTGVTIKWTKSAGASKYRLFFKSGGEWKPLATVAGTSYTHKVTNGNKYTYTVRCMNSAGKYNSGFSRDGWSHTAPNKVIQPTSVALNRTAASVDKGGTLKLTATVLPSNATNKTITWSSSDSSVATVSGGTVTAKSSGYAYIYAKSSNGLSASCYITVKTPFKAKGLISDHIILGDNGNYYDIINQSEVKSNTTSEVDVKVRRFSLAKTPANRDNTLYVAYNTKEYYVVDTSNNLYYYNGSLTKIAGNVKSVFVSPGNFSGYINTSNDLYMWGNNYYGQIGVGDTNLNTRGITQPTKVLSNVKTVSLGRSHAVAVLNNGNLYAWGSNGHGQIGNGSINNSGIHSPIKIMSNVKAAAAGDCCSAAVNNDGILYTWGENSSGELGDGTTTDRYAPVRIMSGIKEVQMFDERVAALSTVNKLYTWGDDSGHSSTYQTSPKVLTDSVKAFYIGDSYNYFINNSNDLYLYSFQYSNKLYPDWYETITPKKINLFE